MLKDLDEKIKPIEDITIRFINLPGIKKKIDAQGNPESLAKSEHIMRDNKRKHEDSDVNLDEYEVRCDRAKKELLTEAALNFWHSKLDDFSFTSYERFSDSFKDMYEELLEEKPKIPKLEKVLELLSDKGVLKEDMNQVSFADINLIFAELVLIFQDVGEDLEVFVTCKAGDLLIEEPPTMSQINAKIEELKIEGQPEMKERIEEEKKEDIYPTFRIKNAGIEEEKEKVIQETSSFGKRQQLNVRFNEKLEIKVEDGDQNGEIFKNYQISDDLTEVRNFYLGRGGSCYMQMVEDKEISMEQFQISMRRGQYWITCTAKGEENITTYELPHKQKLLLNKDDYILLGNDNHFLVDECEVANPQPFVNRENYFCPRVAPIIKAGNWKSKLVLKGFNDGEYEDKLIILEAAGHETKKFTFGRGQPAPNYFPISKKGHVSNINTFIIHEEGKWYLADGDLDDQLPKRENGFRMRTCLALNTMEQKLNFKVSPEVPLLASGDRNLMIFHAGASTIWVIIIIYIIDKHCHKRQA